MNLSIPSQRNTPPAIRRSRIIAVGPSSGGLNSQSDSLLIFILLTLSFLINDSPFFIRVPTSNIFDLPDCFRYVIFPPEYVNFASGIKLSEHRSLGSLSEADTAPANQRSNNPDEHFSQCFAAK